MDCLGGAQRCPRERRERSQIGSWKSEARTTGGKRSCSEENGKKTAEDN